MIKIGDQAKLMKRISEKDVLLFSEISGDKNPIHLNQEYAEKSIFCKRIAHGMLSASFISNVIGNQLPGEGTIYLKQTLNFCKPVYFGDLITTIVEVIDIDYDRANIKLDTKCINQEGMIVIEGEAYVKNRKSLQ
ncbi:MaoC family dehydratase [[Eubacterium] hominis]|uniref:MaoC family dehydratase n=1 Tax=[Eubacterium] hominis TaxID=2764325 RepID=UPI003A4D32EB